MAVLMLQHDIRAVPHNMPTSLAKLTWETNCRPNSTKFVGMDEMYLDSCDALITPPNNTSEGQPQSVHETIQHCLIQRHYSAELHSCDTGATLTGVSAFTAQRRNTHTKGSCSPSQWRDEAQHRWWLPRAAVSTIGHLQLLDVQAWP